MPTMQSCVTPLSASVQNVKDCRWHTKYAAGIYKPFFSKTFADFPALYKTNQWKLQPLECTYKLNYSIPDKTVEHTCLLHSCVIGPWCC